MSGVYAPHQKHHGLIPEIERLPISVIVRSMMDFRPETLSVSADVAAHMDYSEPVDVTAFRYSGGGWLSTDPPQRDTGDPGDDRLPQVVLADGHHRLASAIQTGRAWLPVRVRAVNAKGSKLNLLIALSDDLNRSTNPPDIGVELGGDYEPTHDGWWFHGEAWMTLEGGEELRFVTDVYTPRDGVVEVYTQETSRPGSDKVPLDDWQIEALVTAVQDGAAEFGLRG